jgi:hypothetical protein
MGKQRPLKFLALLGEPPVTSFARNLRAFRFLVLVHVSVQTWAYVIKPFASAHIALPRIGSITVAIVLTACCALALTRYARLAPVLALPALVLRLYWTLLWIPNHTFLVFVCVVLLALLDPDREDEGDLLLQSLRWVAIVVLCYTGVQKALHGCWFRGEFLAWMVSHGTDDWRWVLGWLVPAEEMARLRSFGYEPGSGPYRVASIPFIVLSNLTYLAEIALAVLLLLRRTRTAAAVIAISLVLLIQLAPREFMFFLLFSNILLLFIPGNQNRRLAPLLVFLYLYLLGAFAGILPGEFLVKATGRI